MGERGVEHVDIRLPSAWRPRPRLGVLLVTSGWFREVGLQGADSDTTRDVGRAASAILERLEPIADPVSDGVLFSPPEAEAAARRMLAEKVDGVLLVPLMWCEDAIPRAALRLLDGLPLVVWTYSPGPTLPDFVPFQLMIQGSGPVCTMQLSGMFRREHIPFVSVAGHAGDPRVYEQIDALCRAMAVRRFLREARVGLLPFPCEHMSSTWVDEAGLRARYGTEIRHLELERIRKTAGEFPESEVRKLRHQVTGAGTRVEVDERNLVEGIRYALAMEQVMREEHLAALAMNDVISQMHASFGLRPCLANPSLSDGGAVVSMEGDLGAAMGMLALRVFTGQSPFYTEPFSVDYASEALLMGHAGYHDAANADPGVPLRVVRDVEYENTDRFTGAVTLFKYRPGPVTAVNSTWDDGRLRWCCVEGESLPGPAKMEGNCHVVFRPGMPVRDFCARAVQAGISQHWVFVPGHCAGELAALCAVLDVRLERLDGGSAPI
jgi:L-fucose isomerase-like protein